MKHWKFVHCPRPGCDKPLKGSWKDYLTGETHPKTGLPVYQCPYCRLKFTADAFKANAVAVPDDDTDIVLFDTLTGRVVDIIPHEMKFTDGQFAYIHVPINICLSKTLKCFCFKAKGMKPSEIERVAKEAAINSGIEVFR